MITTMIDHHDDDTSFIYSNRASGTEQLTKKNMFRLKK